MTIKPGVYNIHNMTLAVREDGVQVLQIEVAEPGQHRALAIVETVLAGPPPTPEDAVIANAKARAYHCLHTKYGEDDPTVEAFIVDRETKLGDEAWTPYYSDSGREEDGEGVMFIRDWLVKDYGEFADAHG